MDLNLLLCRSHGHCSRVGEDPDEIHESSAPYPVDDPPASMAGAISLTPPGW